MTSSDFCLMDLGVKRALNAEVVEGGGMGWVMERGRSWAKKRERFQSVLNKVSAHPHVYSGRYVGGRTGNW